MLNAIGVPPLGTQQNPQNQQTSQPPQTETTDNGQEDTQAVSPVADANESSGTSANS